MSMQDEVCDECGANLTFDEHLETCSHYEDEFNDGPEFIENRERFDKDPEEDKH